MGQRRTNSNVLHSNLPCNTSIDCGFKKQVLMSYISVCRRWTLTYCTETHDHYTKNQIGMYWDLNPDQYLNLSDAVHKSKTVVGTRTTFSLKQSLDWDTITIFCQSSHRDRYYQNAEPENMSKVKPFESHPWFILRLMTRLEGRLTWPWC